MVPPGASPTFGVNSKELQEQGKLAAVDAARKQAEAEKQFSQLKAHFEAGFPAIDQMKVKAAQGQPTKIPKDQKDQQNPIKKKINQAGSPAVTKISGALDLMKAEDSNRPVVLSRLGEASESMNKWQEAADT